MFAATSTCSPVTKATSRCKSGEHRDNDGVLMVDTGSAAMTDRVVAELRKLTAKPVRYLVNTSADPDHVGGNAVLSKGDSSRGEGRQWTASGRSEYLCARQRPGAAQRTGSAHARSWGFPP